MRILLEPQIFKDQKFGGISRYFSEIYKHIRNENSDSIQLPLDYTENLHIKDQITAEIPFLYNLGMKIPFLKKKCRKKLVKLSVKKAKKILKQQEYDLVVPTYYNPYFLELIGNKPFVLTVYDMIHETFPNYFNDDNHTVPNKKLLMEKANKIIAISQSTKNDILKFYPNIDANKIEIIYLSQSIDTQNYVTVDLPENFILFVGNRGLYKSFSFFIEAVADLVLESTDLHIVCAGGNAFKSEEIELINSLQLTNRIIQQNFEDDELASYYTKAKCFVFPSEYEGFGIPVLESMACGCPIVLAHHSSFPEVAGDAGVYFELNNKHDLKEKVSLLLHDENVRKQYITKGYEQAQKFSWKKTAEECYALFKTVI
ncbi:MAG: glycosyltransferase family 4 protein [Flavobacteriales bacterium]|nr:glycosyltransferase family 4 protein [Flavobacteriales bacterium]